MKYLIALVALFIACEGPVGPQGDQGLQGIPGEDGLPGVANITVVTFSFLSSQIDTSGRGGIYTRTMSEITQEVVDNGVVLVFREVVGYWTPLPITESYDYGNDLEVDETIETTYLYRTGELSILYFGSFDPILLGLLSTGPYKVAVIPPSSVGKIQDVLAHQ